MTFYTRRSAAKEFKRSTHTLKTFDANFKALLAAAFVDRGKQQSAMVTPTASSGGEVRVIESYMLNEAEYIRTFGIYQ